MLAETVTRRLTVFFSRRRLYDGLLCLVATGCSSTTTTNPSACTPGEREACTCQGGLVGTQVCREDSTGFEECDCSRDGGSDGGATGGSGGQGAASGRGGEAAVGGSAMAGVGGSAGGSSCVETNSGLEVCDGRDNDCDGQVDGAAACGTACGGALREGQAYAFCTERLTWSAAAASCAARGMQMASVEDALENAFIAQEMTTRDGTSAPWLGGSDSAAEGDWVWPTGVRFWTGDETGSAVDGRFANWRAGEPNNTAGVENCLRQNLEELFWNDERCDSPAPYVCEVSVAD